MLLNELFNTDLKPGERQGAIQSHTSGELVAFIKTHCSDFLSALKQSDETVLFRGVKNDGTNLFIGQSRDNREPKDTSEDVSNLFDKNLTKMGFEALRRNSIFTTTEKIFAATYGRVFAVFPINGFSFTWSSELHDMFTDFDDSYEPHLADMSMAQFRKYFKFDNKDLVAALNSGNEILIHGKYIAVRHSVASGSFIDAVLE